MINVSADAAFLSTLHYKSYIFSFCGFVAVPYFLVFNIFFTSCLRGSLDFISFSAFPSAV